MAGTNDITELADERGGPPTLAPFFYAVVFYVSAPRAAPPGPPLGLPAFRGFVSAVAPAPAPCPGKTRTLHHQDKKADSKPMREILSRLDALAEFEIVRWNDRLILEAPVEEWPRCDCLLSWHSDGFPLDKAEAYVRLRRPFLINDTAMQDILLDRRKVYRVLQDNSIPVPRHVVVSRDELPPGAADPPGFVEDEDYVEMNGTRIFKPFVEKPVNAEVRAAAAPAARRVSSPPATDARSLTARSLPVCLSAARSLTALPRSAAPASPAALGPQHLHLLPALDGRRRQAPVPQGRRQELPIRCGPSGRGKARRVVHLRGVPADRRHGRQGLHGEWQRPGGADACCSVLGWLQDGPYAADATGCGLK